MNRHIVPSLVLVAAIASNGFGVTAPKFLNLEGLLTDQSNNPITAPTVVEFRIFWGGDANTANSGIQKYDESATITPAADGTYQHQLGAGTPLDGIPLTLATFDTSTDVFLQISVAGQALLPRLKFGTMPFAFHPETPPGMIAMFASDCPTGWTRFTALNGNFPRGADVGHLGGGTGGAATHDHGGFTGVTNPNNNSDSGHGSDTMGGHNHTIASASNIPPYVDVVFCTKN